MASIKGAECLSLPTLRTGGVAPRRLQRTLSFRGGDDVVEALHEENDITCLRIMEVAAHDNRGSDGSDQEHHKRDIAVKAQSSLDACHPNCRWVMGDGCLQTFQLSSLVASISPSHHRRSFLESITDPVPIRALERLKAVNWHPRTSSLVALRTESDGNCLAHAASLAVWGIHDRRLLLRNAIRSFLTTSMDDDHKEIGGSGGGGRRGPARMIRLIRQAWEYEIQKHGVRLEKEALDSEWMELGKMAQLDYGVRRDDKKTGFAYLEACHIFILAHVLRRPIIVFATDWTDGANRVLLPGDAIAGVYLPLELPRSLCSRSPLVLAFDSFHFSPLINTDPNRPNCVPLVKNATLLPMPFFEPGEKNEVLRKAMLRHFLDCETLSDGVLVAKIDTSPPEGLVSILRANILAEEGGNGSSWTPPSMREQQQHQQQQLQQQQQHTYCLPPQHEEDLIDFGEAVIPPSSLSSSRIGLHDDDNTSHGNSNTSVNGHPHQQQVYLHQHENGKQLDHDNGEEDGMDDATAKKVVKASQQQEKEAKQDSAKVIQEDSDLALALQLAYNEERDEAFEHAASGDRFRGGRGTFASSFVGRSRSVRPKARRNWFGIR